MSDAIDMVPVRKNLRELQRLMPGEPEHLYAFAALLADYVNDRIVPEAMHLATSLMMYDLARSESGYSSVKIPGCLLGLSPMLLATFQVTIPAMLRTAAEPDVAARLIAGLRPQAAPVST